MKKVQIKKRKENEILLANDVEYTKILIRLGADIHDINNTTFRSTIEPLQMAVFTRNEEAIKCLVKRGVNMTLKTRSRYYNPITSLCYFIHSCLENRVIISSLIKVGKYLIDETEITKSELIYAEEKYEENKENEHYRNILCLFYSQIRYKLIQ